MRKMIYFIAVLFIGIVFNFGAEAHAATNHYYTNQNTTAYTGSTVGHGATNNQWEMNEIPH